MLRFQTTIASLLGTALVVPVFLGQQQVASLEDALSGTVRALEVLHGLEQRLKDDPIAAMGLVLLATEAPAGEERQRDERLEALRGEVNLLQMELDALQSPLTGAGGAVTGALGTREALGSPDDAPRTPAALGITTGMDDELRARLTERPSSRVLPNEVAPAEPGSKGASQTGARTPTTDASRGTGGTGGSGAEVYSADPLRHGITCYRAGRYAEAYELLTPLDDAEALYWRARVLERLERLDEAITTMERALAKGGEGFELRRAQTDLEFLRWKRDFLAGLPGKDKAASKTAGGGHP